MATNLKVYCIVFTLAIAVSKTVSHLFTCTWTFKHRVSLCNILNSESIFVHMLFTEIASWIQVNCIIYLFHDHCIPESNFVFSKSINLKQTATFNFDTYQAQ